MPVPEAPILFMKASSSLCGPFDPIYIPRNSTQTDWEVELGIVIGIGGALLVGKFGSLPVALNAQVIGLAAGFSIATGLFFGYYPARKASLLDPIEALRQQ